MGVRSLALCYDHSIIYAERAAPCGSSALRNILYLYLSGLSPRHTARVLVSTRVARSHEVVRLWVHKLATKAEEIVSGECTETAVVDETAVNVGDSQVWLWVAVEPERRVLLALGSSETRNILAAYNFLCELKRCKAGNY